MCAKCKEAVDLLMTAVGSEDEAMAMLWEVTPFPFGDGDQVLQAAREFVEAAPSSPHPGKGET